MKNEIEELMMLGRYEIGTWILHGKQRHVLIQLRI